MGLTANRQMAKTSTVNRQKGNIFYRQPSNERAKISRQISFLILFKTIFFISFKFFFLIFFQTIFFEFFFNIFFFKYEQNYIVLL